MKFLTYPYFWQLWALGLLAFVVWLLVKYMDPKNRDVGGSWHGTFARIGQTMGMAIVSHFILCVILVNFGKLDEITTFGSGFASQSIVPSVLNIIARKIQNLIGSDDAPPDRPKPLDPPVSPLLPPPSPPPKEDVP